MILRRDLEFGMLVAMVGGGDDSNVKPDFLRFNSFLDAFVVQRLGAVSPSVVTGFVCKIDSTDSILAAESSCCWPMWMIPS